MLGLRAWDKTPIGARVCRITWGSFILSILLSSCTTRSSTVEPRIEFTRVPEARLGGPNTLDAIEGRALGSKPGQRIVLFAKTDVWWVQPFTLNPFTTVQSNSSWKSTTHSGTEYAALLVDAAYIPPAKTPTLPAKGGLVAAVAIAKGGGSVELESTRTKANALRFSGYDWDVRVEASDRGGARNDYASDNAWVDEQGHLHLRITKGPNGWVCAEVRLKDSLGYGTYSFVVKDVGHLDPAAALGIYTYDQSATDQNYREMNIELSRWGDPSIKNGQYAIQPYYVPANVVRFNAPSGKLTHSLKWSPGQAAFRTVRSGPGHVVADYSFSSGVPAPGQESVFIALYTYGIARYSLMKETEVVIDRFGYVP